MRIHFGTLLLSSAIAMVLWGMAHGTSSVDRGLDIPVLFEGVPDDLVIVGQSVDKVNLRVLGSREWESGSYDTGILERVPKGRPSELLEVASLAAALAKFRGAERIDARPVPAGGSLSPWVSAERMERLARRPR